MPRRPALLAPLASRTWLAAVLGALSAPATAAAPAQPDPPAPHAPAACEAGPAGTGCVPGGWFWRGVDEDPHYSACDQAGRPKMKVPDTAPRARVWVDTFYMDQTEVTIAAYKACMKAGKCNKAGPRYDDFSRPTQPVVGVNWYDAVKFCQAQGKHLPTEAEWEKAARGPDGDRMPWGDEPSDCDRAVVRDDAKGGRSCGVKKLVGTKPHTGRVIEVGSRPAGRYGLFDMVGNAEEWVTDWYSASWTACGAACEGINPKGPCGGAEPCPGHRHKSVRGGSWYWPAPHATGIHRRPHIPSNKYFHHFGFRCATSVAEARAMAAAQP